ncbi:hypothetical protein [Halorussus sp. MSC15.2]|uniref:hypothetical protein n=1 Tax=Halorussus sp. MSC15.2 TaxID=2283638 RepID=UPI0013D205B5|nr:hypothetical protein [Halorussus sp. MSC15.2]NEU55288.1 hypothetical protein [Halorussus sp. MSC15.2]
MDHNRLGLTSGLGNVSIDSQGYLAPGDGRGIEMTGNVDITVTPPDTPRYLNRTYTRNLTMDRDRNLTVQLEKQAVGSPDISAFDVSATGQDVDLRFESNEQLSNVTVELGGDAAGTLTLADFSETNNSGTYVYSADVSSGRDGTFRATLIRAEDADGDDGASGRSESVTVDTEAPSVNVTVRDATDGNGVVNDGDEVRIEATVVENVTSVANVTADATGLGAGVVELTRRSPTPTPRR